MKQILLVGKLNQAVQNLNECLSQRFQVQVCAESLELVRGMMKVVKPEMVVISVIDLNGRETEVFDLLWNAYSKIPVIVIGTAEECGHYQGYFEREQFEQFLRPVSRDKLLNRCCELLGVENKADPDKKEELKEPDKKWILVVDDSSLALRSTKAMLDDKYNVFVANSGQKALAFIKKRRPDLILLDYEMPDCDGRQTLEMIRQDKEIADIPVIFLTAVADKDHITAVLRLNPKGYFRKPLEKDKVLQAIADILGE